MTAGIGVPRDISGDISGDGNSTPRAAAPDQEEQEHGEDPGQPAANPEGMGGGQRKEDIGDRNIEQNSGAAE